MGEATINLFAESDSAGAIALVLIMALSIWMMKPDPKVVGRKRRAWQRKLENHYKLRK